MQEIKIFLEDARKVRDLEERVKALERERERLRRDVLDLEYKFRCESIVNQELIDLCRASGVKFRPGLDARTWGPHAPEGGLEHRPCPSEPQRGSPLNTGP
jgi:hypothetical protein